MNKDIATSNDDHTKNDNAVHDPARMIQSAIFFAVLPISDISLTTLVKITVIADLGRHSDQPPNGNKRPYHLRNAAVRDACIDHAYTAQYAADSPNQSQSFHAYCLLALTNSIMGLRISSFMPGISIISSGGCASSMCSKVSPARSTPIRICVRV